MNDERQPILWLPLDAYEEKIMALRLKRDKRDIRMDIVDYQFFYRSVCPQLGAFDEDANWLRVSILAHHEGAYHQFCDSCLLTTELTELAEQAQAALDGRVRRYKSDFMEPYLTFSIARRTPESYRVGLAFVIDTHFPDWKRVSVSEICSRERMLEIRDALAQMAQRFPVRYI